MKIKWILSEKNYNPNRHYLGEKPVIRIDIKHFLQSRCYI